MSSTNSKRKSTFCGKSCSQPETRKPSSWENASAPMKTVISAKTTDSAVVQTSTKPSTPRRQNRHSTRHSCTSSQSTTTRRTAAVKMAGSKNVTRSAKSRTVHELSATAKVIAASISSLRPKPASSRKRGVHEETTRPGAGEQTLLLEDVTFKYKNDGESSGYVGDVREVRSAVKKTSGFAFSPAVASPIGYYTFSVSSSSWDVYYETIYGVDIIERPSTLRYASCSYCHRY